MWWYVCTSEETCFMFQYVDNFHFFYRKRSDIVLTPTFAFSNVFVIKRCTLDDICTQLWIHLIMSNDDATACALIFVRCTHDCIQISKARFTEILSIAFFLEWIQFLTGSKNMLIKDRISTFDKHLSSNKEKMSAVALMISMTYYKKVEENPKQWLNS